MVHVYTDWRYMYVLTGFVVPILQFFSLKHPWNIQGWRSEKFILEYNVSPTIHGRSDDGGKGGWWKTYSVYLPPAGLPIASSYRLYSIKPTYQLCKIVVNNNVSVSHLVAFAVKLSLVNFNYVH